jgi:energy-coupling factor transport system permease protein
MAFRISIGQYYPGDSLLHRMDPRAKVACALVICIAVFFVQTPAQLAFGLVCALAMAALSRVPVRELVRSIRPLVTILFVLGIFNLLLVRSGEVLVSASPLLITTDGVRAALLYPLRMVIAIVAVAVLLLTTTPSQLTDALDSALSPLAHIGLPGHEIAMVFALMLRFVPTLADEASAIVDAQTVRGAAVGEGSLGKRIRSIIPILVALLASAAHHADGLSRALDARCYVGGAARSRWHPLHYSARDAAAALATVAFCAGLALLA